MKKYSILLLFIVLSTFVFGQSTPPPSGTVGATTTQWFINSEGSTQRFFGRFGASGIAVAYYEFMTAPAVKDSLNKKQNIIGFTPENIANRATSLASPDNNKYPTTLAVSNAISEIPLPNWSNITNKPNTISGFGITDVYTKSETDGKYYLKTNPSNFITSAQAPVQSVSGKIGIVVLNKGDVGLGNVDNTSDPNKPISNAQSIALNDKVDKVTGKGLSAEDYTTVDKAKLASIATGAEVNVNSDWNAVSGDAQILNKPATASNLTIGTRTATTIPVNNDNGTGVVLPIATTSLSGLQSSADKTKLDGIATGATANQTDAFLLARANQTGFQPISTITNLQTSLDDKIPLSQKGANNGVATLDAGGKVPLSQLPTGSSVFKGSWDASTNTPTLSDAVGTAGWYYIVTVGGTRNLGSGNITWIVDSQAIYDGTKWGQYGTGNAVTSVNGQMGDVVLTKSDIGLSNVDNTTDLLKPISTATQTALNLKENSANKSTAALGTSTTLFPTQSAVKTYVDNAITANTGASNLSIGTRTSNILPIANSNGTGVDLPVATTALSGTLSAADKSKLDGISAGATANTGTVTSVGLAVPTGMSVVGTPVTGAGTLTLGYAAGYSLPTSAKQTNWDTAFGWGNHATAGYLPLTGGTLTGALGGTTGSFTGLITAGGISMLNNNNFSTVPFSFVGKNSGTDNTLYTYSAAGVKAGLGIDNGSTLNNNITGNAASATLAPNYLPLTGGALTGALTTNANSGIIMRGLSATGNNYLQFYNNAATRMGYVGYPSTTNNDLYFNNDLGRNAYLGTSHSFNSALKISGLGTAPDGAGLEMSWSGFSSYINSLDRGTTTTYKPLGINALGLTLDGGVSGVNVPSRLAINWQSTTPNQQFNSYSAGNTGVAAAFLLGEYFGAAVGTQSVSPNYYAFNVSSGLTNIGAGGSRLFTVYADGKTELNSTTSFRPSIISSFLSNSISIGKSASSWPQIDGFGNGTRGFTMGTETLASGFQLELDKGGIKAVGNSLFGNLTATGDLVGTTGVFSGLIRGSKVISQDADPMLSILKPSVTQWDIKTSGNNLTFVNSNTTANSTLTLINGTGISVLGGGTFTGGLLGTSAGFSGNVTTRNLNVTSNQVANNLAPILGTLTGAIQIRQATGLYGLSSDVLANGSSWIQAGRFDGTATAYNMLLQPSGGNVGIGTMTPTAALDVTGKVAFNWPSTPGVQFSSYSGGNIATAGAQFVGEYFGLSVATQSTSNTFYAFAVGGGTSNIGGGGNILFRIGADGTTTLNGRMINTANNNSAYAAQVENNGTTNAHGLYVNIGASSTGSPLVVAKNGVSVFNIANSGASTFSGSVTAPTFVGALSGNATTATTATNWGSYTNQVSATTSMDFAIGRVTGSNLMAPVAVTTFKTWLGLPATIGTVTSVASTVAGNALNVPATAITTSGTLAYTWGGTAAQYITGQGNLAALTAAAVGLGNVNNTADLSKPISTSTQTALDGKYNASGGEVSGIMTIKMNSPSSSVVLDIGGYARAQDFIVNSDSTLKKNITPLKNSVQNLMKLDGYSYDWKRDGRHAIGVVAQEIQKVYPEIVFKDDKGILNVDYSKLVAPLIQANNEQQKEIDQLKQDILELKTLIKR